MKDILSEKEAKTRWCPLNRPSGLDGAANRYEDGSPNGNCIAGECMAWRLAHKPDASGEETGFCGAFGVPRHT